MSCDALPGAPGVDPEAGRVVGEGSRDHAARVR